MMNKAVVYARLSREDEDKIDGNKKESRSIENQIKFLTSYAEKNGLTVTKIYYDDGVSGGTFDRPAFNEMIKDMKRKRFNVILIKDFSRLGRVMHKVGDFVENIFPAYNIRLISVSDNYDSFTSVDDESVVLRYFVNEFYLKDFKKKCRNARTHHALTKHLNYYPKYGYNFDEDRNEIVDEVSANIVKMIFDLIGNQGVTPQKVAELLNEKQIPTRSLYATKVLGLKALNANPAKEWNAEKVWEIASDYEYCGHSLNWTRHKAEERILLKNTHIALIDEDLFWKAQSNIKKRSRIGVRLNHIAKLLVDIESNKNLYFHRGKDDKVSYYFKRKNGLEHYKILKSAIEETLYLDALDMVQRCRHNKEKLYEFYKNKLFNRDEFNKDKLKNQLRELNRSYERVLEDYFAGKLPENVFEAEGKKYSSKITKIEDLLEHTDEQQAKLDLFDLKFKKFIDSLREIPMDKYKLIQMVISKVYISPPEVDGEFNITIKYKIEE